MIRNFSRENFTAAVVYARGKSDEHKILTYYLAPIFFVIFVGLALPAEARQYATIDGGYVHSVGIKTDGTVVAWGDRDGDKCNVPSGLSGVVEVAVGFYHNLALKSDGTVRAWGDNRHNQIDVPAGLSGVISVAAAEYHSLALKSDGTVTA